MAFVGRKLGLVGPIAAPLRWRRAFRYPTAGWSTTVGVAAANASGR